VAFVQDIEEIAGMIGFDVLITTHSPQIIEHAGHAVEMRAPSHD
jgi:hypothetical protein